MIVLLLAYYFSCMVPPQEYPLMVGPYMTWEECASVREYLDRRGYETGGCSLLSYPLEGSVLLEVIEIPRGNE